MSDTNGKLGKRDVAMNRALKLAPWLTILVTSLPVPLVFLVLFFLSQATETAAIFLLLSGVSLAVGAVLGLLIAIILLFYRNRWLARLRDRLASDGITADEVVWFRSELTSAERAALAEIQRSNLLLADAYLDTLASRLTASRIIARTKREMLKVERRINRARTIGTPDANALQADLMADREKLEQLLRNANDHLTKSRTQLQVIEATASRNLNESETNLMMQRLGTAEQTLPLVLELAKMEQQLLLGDTEDKQPAPQSN